MPRSAMRIALDLDPWAGRRKRSPASAGNWPAGLPDVQLRTEPAHDDVSIRLAPGRSWPQVLPAFDALSKWVTEHHREPQPGLRQVYLVDTKVTPPELVGIDMTIALAPCHPLSETAP